MRKEILIQILLIILVLIILIFVYEKYFNEETNDSLTINKDEITKAENNLINIEYESIDREGRRYIITAETGNFKKEKSELIFMTNVTVSQLSVVCTQQRCTQCTLPGGVQDRSTSSRSVDMRARAHTFWQ